MLPHRDEFIQLAMLAADPDDDRSPARIAEEAGDDWDRMLADPSIYQDDDGPAWTEYAA